MPGGMPPGGGMPGGIPQPTPTAPRVGGGLPVPPGIPVGPPPAFQSPGIRIDPSNPLAAAMAPAHQPQRAKSVPPPQPQRIEMDELTVQEARKGARKQGLIAGIVVGVVLGAVGYIAGGASAEKKTRETSALHAKSLAGDVTKSREQLKTISEKVEAARLTLGKDRKFPDTLAKDLAGIVVEFDGSKLAGVRFSGFSTETTTGLIEYITGVQAINDRKNALINILNRLQKPISEQIKAASENKPPPITFVVLLGNKDKDRNPYAVLAPLQKPIDNGQIPAEMVVVEPGSKANVSAPKATSLDKAGAAYVTPQSIQAAIPSETAGQIGQLVSQLSNVINEIQGEKPAAGQQDIIVDTKPGLLQRADKLVEGLNRVN